MFLALSDLRMSLEGGEPTATPRGAAGAARAAEAVPSPARTPAAMPQGAAATLPSGFASGRLQLESAIKKRRYVGACLALATARGAGRPWVTNWY